MAGVPITLLIFILALEPLACAICENAEIMGNSVGGGQFKINSDTDDILLTLSDPLTSATKVLEIINHSSYF